MEALAAYVIPVSSLRSGRNELDFKVDWRFFRYFEVSPVQQGSFDITVFFDKYTDHWHLYFDVRGQMDTECDRCLAPISLPVSGNYELFVKFDVEKKDVERSAEIIYVSRETRQLDIAQFIYEFIVLSIPVKRSYDCENETNPPCDKEMVARLERQGAEMSNEALSEMSEMLKKMLK
ncbi:MAG TPA: DUF177 domain-containing protein [Saprospiraceae bacterium]|nr:DUF177 domain-containing protein [Saprospiraceae bacterium]